MENEEVEEQSENEEEELDPRVQIELEKLNLATDEINCLESSLEEANNAFRTTLSESANQLQTLSKKLGDCIKKARPYYEAVDNAKMVQMNCQRAAVQYQRAHAVHMAARETISLAEERFLNSDNKERQFDSAWQEMLNHATIKVMEAEAQKAASEREHERRAAAFTEAERYVQDLHRKLKSSILKSQPYFAKKASVDAILEAQKQKVQRLHRDVSAAKAKYACSLRQLEEISEEIHELRRFRQERLPGVGAELPQSQQSPFKSPSASTEDLTAHQEEYWENLREKLTRLDQTSESSSIHSNLQIDKTTEGENPGLIKPLPMRDSPSFARNVVVFVAEESKVFHYDNTPQSNKDGQSIKAGQTTNTLPLSRTEPQVYYDTVPSSGSSNKLDLIPSTTLNLVPDGERPACEGQVESPVHSEDESCDRNLSQSDNTNELVCDNVGLNNVDVDITLENDNMTLDNVDSALGDKNSTLVNTDSALGYLNATIDNTDSALDNENSTIDNSTLDNVESTLKNTNSALEYVDPILNNKNYTFGNVDPKIKNVESTSDNENFISDNVDPTLNNIDSALGNVESILDNKNSTLDNVDSALDNTDSTLDNVNITLDNQNSTNIDSKLNNNLNLTDSNPSLNLINSDHAISDHKTVPHIVADNNDSLLNTERTDSSKVQKIKEGVSILSVADLAASIDYEFNH